MVNDGSVDYKYWFSKTRINGLIKTSDNFTLLLNAITEFGLPLAAVREHRFFSDRYDVFSLVVLQMR